MNQQSYVPVARRSSSVLAGRDGDKTAAIFEKVLHRLIADFAARHVPLPFVQVGTNDAERGDRLSRHILRGGWRGILIEPQADALAAARRLYAEQHGLVFEQVAIWPDDDPPPFWAVRGESVLSSFSRETIELHAGKYDDLDAMIEETAVATARLDDLCARHDISPDLVAVDTEGADDLVLSTMDFDVVRPALVMFEHVMLSQERSAALVDLLRALDYRLLYDRHDCLAVQPHRFDPALLDACEAAVTATRT